MLAVPDNLGKKLVNVIHTLFYIQMNCIHKDFIIEHRLSLTVNFFSPVLFPNGGNTETVLDTTQQHFVLDTRQQYFILDTTQQHSVFTIFSLTS